MTNLSLGEGFLYLSRETATHDDYASDSRERFSLFVSCGAHMLGLYGRRGDLAALNYCSSDNEIKITTKDKPMEKRAEKRGHHFAALRDSTKCEDNNKKTRYWFISRRMGEAGQRWKDKQSRFVVSPEQKNCRRILIIRTAITSRLLLRYSIFYSWRSNRGRIPAQKAGFEWRWLTLRLSVVRRYEAVDPSKAVMTRCCPETSQIIPKARQLFSGYTNYVFRLHQTAFATAGVLNNWNVL